MMKPTFATLVRLSPVLALLSCAPPKAIVVGPPPAPKKEKPVVEAMAAVPEPSAPQPSKPDDGIRLPDMVTMPGEDEFRKRTAIPPAAKPDSGAVIARPPKDQE